MTRPLLLLSLLIGCGRVELEPDAGVIDTPKVIDATNDAPVDAAADAPVDAPARMVIAELASDTAADELTDNWNFDQLQPVTTFTNATRWTFTCQGGGATAGTWTVDMTKANADACINRIVNGPAADYPVTQVSGTSTLTAPLIQCGSNKQVSLRATGVELFTLFPPHTGAFEGQWCNNVVSSGVNPTSQHRLTVVER
jgi:hypothetical protein